VRWGKNALMVNSRRRAHKVAGAASRTLNSVACERSTEGEGCDAFNKPLLCETLISMTNETWKIIFIQIPCG